MDEDLRLNLDVAETVTGTRSRRSLPLTSYLIFAGIVVLIVAAGLVLFFQFQKRSMPELEPIENRLKMVEQNLPQLAGLVMELQKSVSKLDATGESLTRRMDELSQEVAQLHRAAVTEQTKSKAPVSVQEESVVKTDATYHQVQPGETLYGIAKKYGIPLAELCRLNQIGTGQAIKPGQKLLVSKQGAD
jgi:LysM repeat protein